MCDETASACFKLKTLKLCERTEENRKPDVLYNFWQAYRLLPATVHLILLSANALTTL
jgi:hypothetical protein